jgi:anthranilate phosphoribosyltransferase
VVKHGNRAASSKSGSADVLEGLGLSLDVPPEDIPERLREDGFVFLFAPRFHPSFRHIMPIRRELGVRTLFNLMGPLVNPAKPGLCFFGVPRKDILPLFANTLARMGGRSGAVVCGAGDYDELTTLGAARIAYVRGGAVRFEELDPGEYGFTPATPEELAVSCPEEGADVLRELLDGRGPEPMRQMLALNIGFGLHLLHPEKPLQACMAEGKAAVAGGVGGIFVRKLLARRKADGDNRGEAVQGGVNA